MSAADENNQSNCADCGKNGNDLKACTACKLVKYCDATCQKAHWSKHKKECKKRAAELKDEALFNDRESRYDEFIAGLLLFCAGRQMMLSVSYGDPWRHFCFVYPLKPSK